MLRDKSCVDGILVCGEIRQNKIHSVTKELLGKAREIAGKMATRVTCLLICGQLDDMPEELFCFGAERVIVASHDKLEYFNQEITAKILSYVVEKYLPEVILAPATTSGRTYLPSVAAMLHTGLTADCTSLDIEDGSGLLLQTRPAIGGNVMATIKTPNHVPQMATVRPKTFRMPEKHVDGNGEIIFLDIPPSLLESRIEVIGKEYASETVSNVQDKDVIVSGGKGLRKAENFNMLHKLAELLGGGVGASRPTVEAKWIGYPHQIGLSGRVVSPKCYFAIGISGAIQHLAGMQTAQKIIAINKDPEAPIFQIADVALCGDFKDIVPVLINRIRREVI